MTIKVGGLIYKVKRKNLNGNSLEPMFGLWDMARMQITLNKGMPKELESLTLIHEIQHAINEQAGIENDEDMTHRMANVWHQVLTDNWQTLKSIFEKE